MIHYEPHPRWLPDILRLPLSSVVRHSLWSTAVVVVYAVLLTWILQLVPGVRVPHGAAAFSVFGGVTSIALAFRLNNAKARWWEARVQWGALVNHARNFAALVSTFWRPDDRDGRRRVAALLGDFAVGLSSHLRGAFRLEELIGLSDDERRVAARRSHPLSYLAALVWTEIDRRRAEGVLDTAQVLLLQPHAKALLDILGACERIRKTPIPFAATAAIRAFLLAFTIFVPLGLHVEFGWMTVPVAAAVHFILAVMDKLAAELEDPFGEDYNDLPTRFISEMIRRQVHEIVEVPLEGVEDTQPVRPRCYQLVL